MNDGKKGVTVAMAGRPKGVTVIGGAETNVPAILRDAMKARGYSQTMLASEVGYASQSGISGLLNGRNVRVDVLVTVLDKLGFDVIVKDRNGANRDNVWKIGRVSESAGTEETGGE